MRLFLVLLLCHASLAAVGIDALIGGALARHDSLRAIEQRLEAADEQIARSRAFADPQLALTVNDIQFDAPADRTLEPMQFTALSVRQGIPWFGKRDAAADAAGERKQVLSRSLEAAQVKLAEAIRIAAYTVKELEARLALLRTYETVARRSIELNAAYTATQTRRHMGIMSAELTLSQIKIRLRKTEAALRGWMARLAYLSQTDVATVEIDGALTAPKPLETYLASLDVNPGYRVKRSEEEAAAAQTRVASLAEYPDPFVQVGYYYREAHPDYLSVSVGAALPIYGTQAHDAEAARRTALAAGAEAADYRAMLESDLRRVYAEREEAYRIYRIIREESLPQIEHMFALSSASVQTGEALFPYIELLEKKLRLEEQLIAAEALCRRNNAKLKALTGVIR